MNNLFTKEQLEKAQNTKTVDELIAFAVSQNIILSQAEATNIFASWHPQDSQLSDEELDQVSGGSTDTSGVALHYPCPKCGWNMEYVRKKGCKAIFYCKFCNVTKNRL